MIENVISKELIELYEPSLTKYFDDTRINLAINESLSSIIQILKNENKKIRLYCVPLILCEVENNSTFESDYIYDNVERLSLIIEYQDASNLNFNLYGSNDANQNILIKTFNLNGSSKIQDYLINTFAYYKCTLSGVYSKVKAFLIERSYYKAQLYKTIEILIRGLSISQADSWFEKADFYLKEFQKELENMLLTYDSDEDGIADDFNKKSIKKIDLLR